MKKNKITLAEAVKFHGHLGPYLVLGLLAGEFALKKLGSGKYFGLKVKVRGALKKPKSCLIDGLQLSTGATYGKGNIHKAGGNKIIVLLSEAKNNKQVRISLKESLARELDGLKGHKECEDFAKKLYRTDPLTIFNLTF